MKILVACEESQTVTAEFRKNGHEAYSCDMQPCSGGHPEWHIVGDALRIINGKTAFQTMDGTTHAVDRWDMIIAHPPCTYLTNTGNRWFNVERYGDKALQRHEDRKSAQEFFMEFVRADCDRIAIENPVGVMSTAYRKPTQIIQPYEYGENAKKATCLWLKGLGKLQPTQVIEPETVTTKNGKTFSKWYYETSCLPHEKRAKARSKTFVGIARAMAAQWG